MATSQSSVAKPHWNDRIEATKLAVSQAASRLSTMPVATATPQETGIPMTAEDLWQLGSTTPGELVRGRFIHMPPTGHPHGTVEANVAAELRAFVKQRRLGKVQSGEVGIITRRNPDTVRGADVVYISNDRLAKARADGYLDIAPELVVEIISPNDRWTEINEKVAEYLGCGVTAVWLIDSRTRRVTCYQAPTEVRVFERDDVLSQPDVLPDFAIHVRELFD
jgi:Uma2 family endonuclease